MVWRVMETTERHTATVRADVEPPTVRVIGSANGEHDDAWSALARVEERERIARDLHDVAVQSLLGIGIQLKRIADESCELTHRGELELALHGVDAVIAQLRDYIYLLRPRVAGQRTLGDALLRIARETEIRTHMSVRVALDSTLADRLSSQATELVALVRESLSNAARHGQARYCSVALVPFGDAALLTVRDDGAGFDPETASYGDGVRNMRERAAFMGAYFDVVSRVGGPTIVRALVPLYLHTDNTLAL